MDTQYSRDYFDSTIFDYDYEPIASAIMAVYAPKTVIEFGCGNGQLSKALASKGVQVTALDGYAHPDFASIPNIRFQNVDLDNSDAVREWMESFSTTFDVAVCMEVAEHLKPEISESLVDWLTASADVIVFSSAVINQGGSGHINCRSRLFWHSLFEARNFLLQDRIRALIRDQKNVAPWYSLNTVDYVRLRRSPTESEYRDLVANLVASESAAASAYYRAQQQVQYKDQLLHFGIVRAAFRMRNMIKRLLGKPSVSTDWVGPS